MATRPLFMHYRVGQEVNIDVGERDCDGVCICTDVQARRATFKRKSDGAEIVVAMTEDEPLNLEDPPEGEARLRADGKYHYGDNWKDEP